MKTRRIRHLCSLACVVVVVLALIPAVQSFGPTPGAGQVVGPAGSQIVPQVFPTTVAVTGIVTAYTPATPTSAGSISLVGVTIPIPAGSVYPRYVGVGACVYLVYIPGNPNSLVEISPGFHCPTPVPTSTPKPVIPRQVPTATPVPAIPSLTVHKTVRDVTRGGVFTSSAYAAPGDVLEYQITVTNTGRVAAQGVLVTDAIEAFQTDAGRTLRCALGDLGPGQSQSFTYREGLAPGALNGQQIYNTVSARAGNANWVSSRSVIEVSGPAGHSAADAARPVARATKSAPGSVASFNFQSCSLQ